MAGKYTDAENVLFSRIAYQDLNSGYQMAKRSGNYPDGKVPLKDLPPQDIAKLKACGVTQDQINSWKLADVHDTNAKNGFYGCIIDTNDGRAAVAFRGSEDMLNGNNAENDWADADFSLLNQTQTRQHAEVDRFLAKNKQTLQGYNSISTTGHSLGGNLAEYATIVSDQYGLDGKIKQCTSLDGPGFNKEFLKQHAPQIDKMRDVMTHYRWSLVGNCLNDPAGKDITARVSDDKMLDPVGRHSLDSLEYNNGTIKPSDRLIDPFNGGIVHDFTSRLDKYPKPIKDGIAFTVNTIFVNAIRGVRGVKDTFNKVTNWFGEVFGGKDRKGGAGGHSSGGGRHDRGGAGGKNRLLVSTEAMMTTINRYKAAREKMDAAIRQMNAAWEQLNRVWDGSIKTAFMGEWILLMGNIRKSDQAMEKSLNGMVKTVTLFSNTESDLTGRAQSLDPGTVPPLF